MIHALYKVISRFAISLPDLYQYRVGKALVHPVPGSVQHIQVGVVVIVVIVVPGPSAYCSSSKI